MLDRMQEMARSGDRDDAQRMLEQLQNTLENLQMARRRDADPTTRALNQALRDLDKLTREQQQLRDETNRQAQAQKQAQEQQDESDDQQQGQPNAASPQGPSDQGQNPSGQQNPMSEQEFTRSPAGSAQRARGGGKGIETNGPGSARPVRSAESNEGCRESAEPRSKSGPEPGRAEPGRPGSGPRRPGHGSESGRPGSGWQPRRRQRGRGTGRALEALRKGAEQLAKSMQQGGEGQGAEGDQPGDQEGGVRRRAAGTPIRLAGRSPTIPRSTRTRGSISWACRPRSAPSACSKNCAEG